MHLVDQNSKRPPIHSLSMPLIQNHLRSYVLRRSTDGKRSSLGQKLGKSEVSELQVAIIADQQVFRLEVSEDDVFGVQILKTTGNCGRVEPSLVSSERFHISEVSKELSSVDQLKHEIEISGILSQSFEGDDKRMADLRMHEVLVINMVDLLCLHDLMLVEQLQGNVLPCFFILGDLNFPKATYMDQSLPLPSILPTS